MKRTPKKKKKIISILFEKNYFHDNTIRETRQTLLKLSSSLPSLLHIFIFPNCRMTRFVFEDNQLHSCPIGRP